MEHLTIAGKDIRDAFFDEVYELAKQDENVVFITDDMDAFSLRKFKQDFPERFINIGVAEQNMIDVAAGLASCGKRVFVYGICSFVTMRCLEQIKFSLCSMNLPVTIVGVGAGFSFSYDGPTHHGTQDVAVMRALPEMTVYNPSDAISAAAAAHAGYNAKGPVYVRLDKGVFNQLYKDADAAGRGYAVIKPVQPLTILATGFMTHVAVSVAADMASQGVAVGVVDVSTLKPLPAGLADEVLKHTRMVVTLEEHSEIGGLGSAISEYIERFEINIRLKRIAVPDKQFIVYGSRQWLHEQAGIDKDSITRIITRLQTND